MTSSENLKGADKKMLVLHKFVKESVLSLNMQELKDLWVLCALYLFCSDKCASTPLGTESKS